MPSVSGLPPYPILNSESLSRLDLVVTLGTQAGNSWPSLPRGMHQRHFELGAAQGAAMAGEIRELVSGIIGGLRMLERSGDEN